MFGTTELQYGYKQTQYNRDLIVTEAFRAALFRVKIAASERGSEGACFIRRSQ